MKKSMVSFDNVKISYEIEKRNEKRPILVFLHGLGGNSTEWKYSLEEARKKKLSTLVMDLRGHGYSDIPEETDKYKLECYIKDLREVLKKEKIKRYVVVGHSFGGCVGLIYCTLFKDLRPMGMVLVEATYKYPYKKNKELNINPFFCRVIKKLIKYGIITNKAYSERKKTLDLTKMVQENFIFQMYDEIYYTAFKVIFDSLEGSRKFSVANNTKIINTLKSLKIPVLLIGGKLDNTIKLEWVEETKKLIPNSILEVFEGSHLLPLEDHKLFNLRLFNFLMTIV